MWLLLYKFMTLYISSIQHQKSKRYHSEGTEKPRKDTRLDAGQTLAQTGHHIKVSTAYNTWWVWIINQAIVGRVRGRVAQHTLVSEESGRQQRCWWRIHRKQLLVGCSSSCCQGPELSGNIRLKRTGSEGSTRWETWHWQWVKFKSRFSQITNTFWETLSL